MFNNFFAKRKLHCWMFSDPVDMTVDALLNSIIENPHAKLKSVERHEITIDVKGTELRVWNANKYYGWLSIGNYGQYYWKEARPTAQTMLKFKLWVHNQVMKTAMEAL